MQHEFRWDTDDGTIEGGLVMIDAGDNLLSFSAPEWAERGKRLPILAPLPWQSSLDPFRVYRYLYPEADDIVSNTIGFIFERGDGFGITLQVLEGSRTVRTLWGAWLPTDAFSGKIWHSAWTASPEDFLGILTNFQTGSDHFLPTEWIAESDPAERTRLVLERAERFLL